MSIILHLQQIMCQKGQSLWGYSYRIVCDGLIVDAKCDGSIKTMLEITITQMFSNAICNQLISIGTKLK